MLAKKAFTLVELLVVATILAIVATGFGYSMRSLSESAQVDAVRSKVVSSVDNLDRAIRNASVGSYEMTFASGAFGYSTVTDAAGVSASGSIRAFDWTASAGTIALSSAKSGSWTIRLSKDNKIVETIAVSGTGREVPIAFGVGRNDAYAASVFFDSEPLNRIEFAFFDRENSLSDPNSRLVFRSASAGGAEYPSFVVRNVLGKKEFLVNGSDVPSVKLLFTRGAKEYAIELSK